MKSTICTIFVLLVTVFTAQGQRPEVTITLNEVFFDGVLDAIFQNAGPIEFAIASNGTRSFSWSKHSVSFGENGNESCKEVIQLQRENNGVRTAVRFREGKVLAPLAFSGNYNPPFVGCVSFAGYAETAIDLEFDQQNQRLVARARVLNVSLNGTGGVGGSVIAKLVQGSIDRKVNPIELFRMDKVSFLLPVQNNTTIRMKAVGVRHEVTNGAVNVHIAYEFVKV